MKIEDVKQLQPMDIFLYWIKERYKIWFLRNAGKPKPWTDDEILQSYFFTNAYREYDKVSVWFRSAFRHRMRDSPEVLFGTICFRWFNYIPTGRLLIQENLLEEWDCKAAVKLLTTWSGTREKVFTGAFNISNGGSTKPKINRVCEDYVQPAWDQRHTLLEKIEAVNTMEAAHKILHLLPGMGGSGFMAYEVVCDLRYTYLLRGAKDRCLWSNPGPGAKRGLNRLLGRELKAPVSKDFWLDQSKILLGIAQKKLTKIPPLEMREIEHSLCEYDKYMRALTNDGHMKRRYAGK